MNKRFVKHYLFSDEVAKKNKISRRRLFGNFILTSVFGLFVIFMSFFVRLSFGNIPATIVSTIGMFIIAAACIKFFLSFRIMEYNNYAYAISEDGGIYVAFIIHVDRETPVHHRFGDEDARQLYKSLGYNNNYNESTQYLKIPEMVDAMINGAEKGINGGEVYEIKNVYSIQDCNDYYYVKCDYIHMRHNKIHNFELVEDSAFMIGKVYNDYEELIDILRSRINNNDNENSL